MMLWDDSPRKRTLGIRDKQILWRRDGKKCGNPACGTKIDFDEMQVGHKRAHSKGGSATLSNTISLCYRCNKLQGTDSWAVFLKKQGTVDKQAVATQTVKSKLQSMTTAQLKALASKHGVKVTGRLVEDWFDSRRVAPTKSQYVTKLSKVLKPADVRVAPKTPTKAKATTKKSTTRKSRKKDDDSWSFF